MVKKQHAIEGDINHFKEYSVYLNINYLEKGTYILRIVHNNKVIKETTFKKL